MKKNILYLAGAAVSFMLLMFGCSEDLPSYKALTVDRTDVFIHLDGDQPVTAEANITDGNGNYKITVADESIATATLEGTRIVFTGLQNGTTTATIMDWSKHSAVINVRVKEDFDLVLAKTELDMYLGENDNEVIGINSGNGNYALESSDDNIATAVLDENGKISVTAHSSGRCNISVTDADGLTATVNVRVYDAHLVLEELENPVIVKGKTASITILSGNGEYTVVSENPTVATAQIEGNVIQVEGLATGETMLTVTDKMGLTAVMTIKVSAGFAIEKTHIDNVWIGEEAQEIAITEGSGGYTIEADNSLLCTLSDDKSKLLVQGVDKMMALNQSIHVTDTVFNQTIDISVGEVNYRFDEYGTARWYIEGAFGTPQASMAEVNSDGRSYMKVGSKRTFLFQTTYYNGFSLSFAGDLTPGVKATPLLYHLNSSGQEVNQIIITDLEVVKRELDEGRGDNGKYWIRFHEEGKSEWSYIITWT